MAIGFNRYPASDYDSYVLFAHEDNSRECGRCDEFPEDGLCACNRKCRNCGVVEVDCECEEGAKRNA